MPPFLFGGAMDLSVSDIFLGIGLLMILEGGLYAIFPRSMKNIFETIEKWSVEKLQLLGLIVLFFGFIIVIYIK